jgi:hypothetical protein
LRTDQAGSRSGLVGDALRESELERVVKRFSASRCVHLVGLVPIAGMVHPVRGRRRGHGRRRRGDRKYAAYEVERGRPFDVVRAA